MRRKRKAPAGIRLRRAINFHVEINVAEFRARRKRGTKAAASSARKALRDLEKAGWALVPKEVLEGLSVELSPDFDYWVAAVDPYTLVPTPKNPR